jgi:hypothetical protein
VKPAAARKQDWAETRALDWRALELLAAGTGHTLDSAYKQALAERDKSLDPRV